METTVLPADHPEAMRMAERILQQDGLVAFPTDTVYGLAASATSTAGIEKLFIAKGRDFNKAIAVLVGAPEQLDLVAVDISEMVRRLVQRFWPGALTLVVLRRPGLPENLSPQPTLGVRMPNHPVALDLLRRTGPLATTSANLSGQANPLSAADVLAQLIGRMDLLIDGGTCPGGQPSTVVDCTHPQLAILREGPISLADLLRG